jgi:RhtB (resistance to homoserine/threonine) family protein
MTAALIGFAVVAGLMTLVPGIDTALVLRTAVTQGRSRAFAAAAGISLGVLIWGVAAALGVSALLSASQFAFNVLRWAGAAYVVWLGLTLIVKAGRGDPLGAEDAVPAPESAWTGFRRGLLTNLLNPKIGVFYVAVLPQFLPDDVSAALAGGALALVHVAEGMAWFTLLILATHLLRSWLSRRAVQTWIDRITGGVLIGFGIKLALWRS